MSGRRFLQWFAACAACMCLLALCAVRALSDNPCADLPCPGAPFDCTRYVVSSYNNGCYNPRTLNRCCSCTCVNFYYANDFDGFPCDTGPAYCTSENNCTTVVSAGCAQ